MSLEIQYVPLDRFLLWLAAGWSFPNNLAAPMGGSHGFWSCLMERSA